MAALRSAESLSEAGSNGSGAAALEVEGRTSSAGRVSDCPLTVALLSTPESCKIDFRLLMWFLLTDGSCGRERTGFRPHFCAVSRIPRLLFRVLSGRLLQPG